VVLACGSPCAPGHDIFWMVMAAILKKDEISKKQPFAKFHPIQTFMAVFAILLILLRCSVEPY
jgi:hypothetical protein